jgi:hypothetical protein
MFEYDEGASLQQRFERVFSSTVRAHFFDSAHGTFIDVNPSFEEATCEATI